MCVEGGELFSHEHVGTRSCVAFSKNSQFKHSNFRVSSAGLILRVPFLISNKGMMFLWITARSIMSPSR